MDAVGDARLFSFSSEKKGVFMISQHVGPSDRASGKVRSMCACCRTSVPVSVVVGLWHTALRTVARLQSCLEVAIGGSSSSSEPPPPPTHHACKRNDDFLASRGRAYTCTGYHVRLRPWTPESENERSALFSPAGDDGGFNRPAFPGICGRLLNSSGPWPGCNLRSIGKPGPGLGLCVCRCSNPDAIRACV